MKSWGQAKTADSNELFNVLCNFIDIQRHADGKTQQKIHMNHKRIASQNP